MNKTEQLLKMLDNPERYSEKQWQEILADDECRELYSMMAKTKGFFAAENVDAEVTDDKIESEWQRLSSEHSHRAAILPLWHKIAAAAAIVVAFFGITIAAMQTNFFGLTNYVDQVERDTETTVQDGKTEVALDEITVEQTTDTIAPAEPHLYDNVPLEQILTDLAARYDVTVEYRNADARSLRLYYEWQPDYTLDKVIEMLNNFEAFSIHCDGNKLIVEQANTQEGKL
ncbi:MAG: DUF4974 domain-containing protein [Muribaculaceae bacterium]|nr:DUF4974 domain-containing protein [Muribaculaceae bacterium]